MLVIALVLGACAGRYPATTAAGPDDRFVVTDSRLARAIVVTAGEVERLEGGGIRVALELLNRSARDVWVDVKVEFFDAGHGVPRDQGPWMPLLLRRNDTTVHGVTSLSARADDFRVTIRRTR